MPKHCVSAAGAAQGGHLCPNSASMEPQTLRRSASAKHQSEDGLTERPGPPKWVPLLILLLFYLVLEEIYTLWLWILVSRRNCEPYSLNMCSYISRNGTPEPPKVVSSF